MTDPPTKNANTDFLLAVIIALSAVGYKFSQSKEYHTLQQTLPRAILLVAIILTILMAIVLVIVRTMKRRYKEKREREEREYQEKELLRQLKAICNAKYYNSEYAQQGYIELQEVQQKLPEHLRGKGERARQIMLEKIRQYQNEERETEEEKREQARNTQRLIAYFLKHHSTTLPRWALHYNKTIISEARKKYELKKEQEYDPPAPLPVDEFLLESKFYHANKLTTKQREALLSHGYRFVPFVHLNGKPGNNLFIKNNPEKESDYHFCMKRLFSELDENARIEYPLGGQRFDIVYIRGLHRVAVEIETGKNKPEHTRKKVAALNQYFDQWIIVTNRQNKPLYKQYTDGQKSHCLTSKKAVEKLHTILPPLTHSKPTAAKKATRRQKPNEPHHTKPHGSNII